jgi:hypothetical protein
MNRRSLVALALLGSTAPSPPTCCAMLDSRILPLRPKVNVDVNPVLFGASGTPRFDLYMRDELHLRPPAYEAFSKILKPVLTQALNE